MQTYSNSSFQVNRNLQQQNSNSNKQTKSTHTQIQLLVRQNPGSTNIRNL